MRHPLAVVQLFLAGSVVAIAGCGSTTTVSVTDSGTSQAVGYVHCMRSHGVPNLPDPGPEGGIQLTPGSGINTNSPAFNAARTQCAKLLPHGGAGGVVHPSEQAEHQMLVLSTCMRAHGVSDFPDPTPGPPPPDPQEFSIAIGRAGVSLLVPKTVDVRSPAFKQAAITCRFGALLGAGKRTPTPQES